MRAREGRRDGRGAVVAALLVLLAAVPAAAQWFSALPTFPTETPGDASVACRPGVPELCDDGNPCTVNDACVNGFCIGTPVRCDDGDPCDGAETCDPASGACVSGTPPSCDDGNPCTDDRCEPAVGCRHANNDAPCDDGTACTTDDRCRDGACTGISVACDDGDACNGVETCDPVDGSCRPGIPLDCDDGNACTDDTCAPGRGCVHANNSAPCDDGSACTTHDACRDGRCAGTPIVCDDGNACNGVETCDELTGRCVAGTPPTCDDPDGNTTDACDPATGCIHPAAPVATAAPAGIVAPAVVRQVDAGDLRGRAERLLVGVRRLLRQES